MTNYTTQAAREAEKVGYGNKGYWDYLERTELERSAYFASQGHTQEAQEMLTRSLTDALRGND